MSVKRYTNGADDDQGTILPFMEESPEGDYVLWEDYDATCETLAHTETERDASDAEVERLKTEVERLRKAIEDADDKLKLLAEWAVVCEVESAQVNQVRDILRNAAKEGKQSEEVLWVQLEDYEKLKAEVERLRKAGDAMADLLSCAGSPPNVVQSWNAAKEGKQS